MKPADPVDTLSAHGVEWEPARSVGSLALTHVGTLSGCPVRYHISTMRGRTSRSVWVVLTPDRMRLDEAYAFASQFTQLVTAQVGEPQSVSASSGGSSARRWQVDSMAMSLGVHTRLGIAVSVEPWADMVRTYFTA